MSAVPVGAAAEAAANRVIPTIESLNLPAIPQLFLEAPLLQLPASSEIAADLNAKIAALEQDLIAQKKDISNRSLGLATDSVVAGFSCDRSIVFHQGVDNIGNAIKEEDELFEQRRLARVAAKEAEEKGEAAPAEVTPTPTQAAAAPYRRDDDETMAKKCEELITLRKERARLLAEKVFTLDKNDAVLEAYYASVEAYVISKQLSLADAEAAVSLAMRLFIAENYTGELSLGEVEHFRPLLARFSYTEPLEERFVSRLLTTDGEMPNPSIVLPALLIFAMALVNVGRRNEDVTVSSNPAVEGAEAVVATPAAAVETPYRFENTNIWRLRVLYRHQLCLLHRAHTLFLRIADCVDALLITAPFNQCPRTLVEVGYVQNYYHKIDLAADNFFKALKISGLELQEEAFMGVRTRWQQQQVAQQVLKARSTTDDGLSISEEQSAAEPLPKVIESEQGGHDILDYPRFKADDLTVKGTDESALSPLSITDKSIILALCLNIRNTNPLHGLVNHHVQVYLERLVVDPAPAVFIQRAVLLLLRSRAEKERSRVAQRSFLQVQELLDQFTTRRDPLQPTFYRSDPRYFYMVQYPSIWTLRREFAEYCFDENLFKTALDLFESIHDFDNVIKCCKSLDKRRRAENLARDLLETDPANPMLWVAVGEATREDQYLWKAWELSNKKMAAPMRSLARMALEREQYEKVVEYFDMATKINPIFGGDWFSLGFASLKLKNLDQGTVAFTRVCQIDPNDAYAWNNLGSLLLQQGKARPAFNAISQALRNNRRSWRMWQNYFSIAVELLEVTEATHALQILLDIAAREVKLDPLALVKFVEAAIRYMKGEINSTDNDFEAEKKSAAERATASGGDVAAAGGLRAGVENVEASSIPHYAQDAQTTTTAAATADDDEECAMDLQAFGADVEMPETFFPAKEAKKKAEEASLAYTIAKRYRDRVKGVFRTITDLFVNDVEIYGSVATLYRFTDGPAEAFRFREKEYRVASQTDQVYRNAEKFSRLVAAISAMSADAIAMLQGAVDPAAPGVAPGLLAGEEALGSAALSNEEEKAKEEGAANNKSAAVALKDAVDAVKKTIGHVDAAAELSAEHLEAHEGARTLQVVRKRLNAAIKEANAAAKK